MEPLRFLRIPRRTSQEMTNQHAFSRVSLAPMARMANVRCAPGAGTEECEEPQEKPAELPLSGMSHAVSRQFGAPAFQWHSGQGGCAPPPGSKPESTPKRHAPLPPPPSTPKERYRCTTAFPASCPYELNLKEGDVVIVFKKRDDGWAKGSLDSDSRKVGLFPMTFVQKL
ncbi:hypothetical protein TCAL_14423 [Tigriopus californicus]|uniref:SH3 domain-containing protein n=1 Tax=Tigriopus californicus TaxID=6832 RepID=A0A553PM09_TIGCA|nr:hypothetical protein TCAL_14423 [Tigriopus californicus]